jgi:hypothetical protein
MPNDVEQHVRDYVVLSAKEVLSLRRFTESYSRMLSVQRQRKELTASTSSGEATTKRQLPQGDLTSLFPDRRAEEPRISPALDRRTMAWFVDMSLLDKNTAQGPKHTSATEAVVEQYHDKESNVGDVKRDSLQACYARRFEGYPPGVRKKLLEARMAQQAEEKQLIPQQFAAGCAYEQIPCFLSCMLT